MNRLQSNLQSVLFNEKIKNLTARRTKKSLRYFLKLFSKGANQI